MNSSIISLVYKFIKKLSHVLINEGDDYSHSSHV
jgi:hypothetical protein